MSHLYVMLEALRKYLKWWVSWHRRSLSLTTSILPWAIFHLAHWGNEVKREQILVALQSMWASASAWIETRTPPLSQVYSVCIHVSLLLNQRSADSSQGIRSLVALDNPTIHFDPKHSESKCNHLVHPLLSSIVFRLRESNLSIMIHMGGSEFIHQEKPQMGI